MRRYLTIVLIGISFIASEVEHLFIYLLAEISQLEKAKNYMISLMWDIKLKLKDTDKSMVVTRGKGLGVVENKEGQVFDD